MRVRPSDGRVADYITTFTTTKVAPPRFLQRHGLLVAEKALQFYSLANETEHRDNPAEDYRKPLICPRPPSPQPPHPTHQPTSSSEKPSSKPRRSARSTSNSELEERGTASPATLLPKQPQRTRRDGGHETKRSSRRTATQRRTRPRIRDGERYVVENLTPDVSHDHCDKRTGQTYNCYLSTSSAVPHRNALPPS